MTSRRPLRSRHRGLRLGTFLTASVALLGGAASIATAVACPGNPGRPASPPASQPQSPVAGQPQSPVAGQPQLRSQLLVHPTPSPGSTVPPPGSGSQRQVSSW